MREMEVALNIIDEVSSLMNDAKYIALDVHQATTSIAVLDSGRRLAMEAVLVPQHSIHAKTMVYEPMF